MIERLGLGRSAIYNLSNNDPSFPKPIKLAARTIAWNEAEVDAWIAARAGREMPVGVAPPLPGTRREQAPPVMSLTAAEVRTIVREEIDQAIRKLLHAALR